MSELKAAAYCRVSTSHDEQESSLEAQISYYEKLIPDHGGWKLVKIYAERAWGTQIKKRPEFMKLLKACLNCTRFLGYDKDENGKLVVESKAVIVRKRSELY